MEKVRIQRMSDGITKITGINRGIPFEAALNRTQTGGVITYHKSTGAKMEALGKFALGEMLDAIEKYTSNEHVEPVVLNAIKPFLPDCPQCGTELNQNLIDNQSNGHCNCERRGQ